MSYIETALADALTLEQIRTYAPEVDDPTFYSDYEAEFILREVLGMTMSEVLEANRYDWGGVARILDGGVPAEEIRRRGQELQKERET